MNAIITHPGTAHRDDFYAVAVLMCLYPQIPVHRRRPTPAELDDPRVFVIDTGGRHEPHLHNFDHHQMKDTVTCALSLVLQWLGIYDAAQAAFPWLEPLEILDSQGPRALEEFLEIRSFKDQVNPLRSPGEEYLVRQFTGTEEILPGRTDLRHIMAQIGRHLVGEAVDAMHRLDLLSDHARLVLVNGVDVLDATDVPDARFTEVLEHWLGRRGIDPAAVIYRNNRGYGWAVYRRPAGSGRLDLNRLRDTRGVFFVHRDGFLAKIRYRYDPWEVVKGAITIAA